MKIPKLSKGDAIEVVWVDANFAQEKGWITTDEVKARKPVTIKSVCLYIGTDKHFLMTAADMSIEETIEEGVMRDLKIPIGCIKSARRLK